MNASLLIVSPSPLAESGYFSSLDLTLKILAIGSHASGGSFFVLGAPLPLLAGGPAVADDVVDVEVEELLKFVPEAIRDANSSRTNASATSSYVVKTFSLTHWHMRIDKGGNDFVVSSVAVVAVTEFGVVGTDGDEFC